MQARTGEVNFNNIIMDNGSGYLKCGFAGDQFPRQTVPSIIGTPELKTGGKVGDIQLKEWHAGHEANEYRHLLKIEHPIGEGRVNNWDSFCKLWEYTLENNLGMKDAYKMNDKKILVTEAALNPKANREKLAELIFEKFNFSGCYFETQALLSLMAEGRNEGLVFDSGDGVSHVIPIHEGYIINAAVKKINLAGRHVTEYLSKPLQQRGYAFNTSADFETVREIKEAQCYVAYDTEAEKKLALETTLLDKDYKLPNGQTIRIGAERFEAAEILFTPIVAGDT